MSLALRSLVRLALAVLGIVSLLALRDCVLRPAHAENCIASIYDQRSGTRTASGRKLDVTKLTAAHKSMPFGALARITNRRSGRSTMVEITDRGPFVAHRCIDLTPAAAAAIGLSRRQGLAAVTVDRVR